MTYLTPIKSQITVHKRPLLPGNIGKIHNLLAWQLLVSVSSSLRNETKYLHN